MIKRLAQNVKKKWGDDINFIKGGSETETCKSAEGSKEKHYA